MKEKIAEVVENEGFLNRRHFLGTAVAAGAFLAACSGGGEGEVVSPIPGASKLTPGPVTAPDGPVLKAGLIGCGGRGTGAAGNFLESAPNLQLVAMADVFEDRLERSHQNLNEKYGVDVPTEQRFVGFDAYKKLLETDIDIVIQATPPHFRPAHFEAAVEARKHVFMEKPVAVDPAGVQSILKTSEKADAFGLNVVTGTQFRHQKSFIETYNRILDGAIGEIRAARGYSLRGQLWYREPEPGQSEMEAMLRDWVNWNWLSGDHIVEQHIHGLDVLFWFTGQFPVKAVAMGGRARRVTGDQYDFFSVDYTMENGIHMTTMCRQVDGCVNNISRWLIGSKGYSNCEDTIYAPNGDVIWTYPKGEGDAADKSPYIQEHTDLVTAIRSGNRVNEATTTAQSTLCAIMARESAYTGLEVTREELMKSEMRLGPTEYAFGPVGIKAEIPVPGTQKEA